MTLCHLVVCFVVLANPGEAKPPVEQPDNLAAIRDAVRPLQAKLEKCFSADAGQSQCACRALEEVRFPTRADGGTAVVSLPVGARSLAFTLNEGGKVTDCK